MPVRSRASATDSSRPNALHKVRVCRPGNWGVAETWALVY